MEKIHLSQNLIVLPLQVANAVGAALSQVSGTFDRFVELTDKSRDEAIAMAKKEAISLAVNNGAIKDTVQIIDICETEITYVTLPMTRIKIKAVGDLERYSTTDNSNDTDVVKSDSSKLSKGKGCNGQLYLTLCCPALCADQTCTTLPWSSFFIFELSSCILFPCTLILDRVF